MTYETDTAWKRGILCKKFKTIIQLYLLCLFRYCMTYCIKEVIKGIIFWILNEKSAGLRGSYGMKQGNHLQIIQNNDQICFVYFLIFWLTVSKTASKAICFDIEFKSVGLWGRYGLKQGNPFQYLKICNQFFFVSCFIVLLNV